MAQTVANVLVGVFEQIGVKHIFGLIGDSLNPLADAVRRSRIEWIGVRHEEGAALAAAGQAKLTGRLGVCAARPVPAARIWSPAFMKQPRPCARAGAVGRHAAQDAWNRLHPDDRARSVVPRRLSLYRNHILSGAGARSHSSSDRRRLCGPRRRPSDAAARRIAAKANGSVASIATLKPRPELAASERTLPKSRDESMPPTISSSCAAADAMAPRTSCARSRIGSRRR